MHLDDMRTINLIAELGSFRRAGECLELTQPAISHRVRQVERAMGVPLFERAGRNVQLTRAGSLFCAFVTDLNDRLVVLRGELAALDQPGGSVTIASPPPSAGWVLPALIREFATRHPGLRVRLLSIASDIIRSRLLRDELDFGVLDSRALVAGLAGEPLQVSARLCLVAPNGHPLTALKGPIPAREVAAYPFVLEAGTRTRRAVDAWADANRVRLRAVLEVDTGEVAFAAIRGCVGIGFVSEMAASSGVRASQVVICPTLGPRPELSSLVLAFRAQRVREPAAAAFLETYREGSWSAAIPPNAPSIAAPTG